MAISQNGVLSMRGNAPTHQMMSYRAFRSALVMATMAMAVALCGCSPVPPWHLANITHHLPDLRFNGMAQNGSPLDAEALRGKIVLLYFGFTHCAEDCPIVMTRLAQVLRDLGPDAQQVTVLFVSLDPIRDQAPTLARYLALFDSNHSIGVTASEEATEALAKRYRVAFYPHAGAPLDVSLPHSAAVYVFDTKGDARLLIAPRDTNRYIENDLRRLLAESGGAKS